MKKVPLQSRGAYRDRLVEGSCSVCLENWWSGLLAKTSFQVSRLLSSCAAVEFFKF